MTATDFEYDGRSLSSMGFMICRFDGSSGFDTSSAGSTINFVRVSRNNSKLFPFASANYDSSFETTPFSIVKPDGSKVTIDEYSEIMRWLNRHDAHELRFLDGGFESVYFEGSFNVEKVEHRGSVVGFTLIFVSTRPFAHMDTVTEKFSLEANESITIADVSEETGHIYPKNMVIQCNASGDLKITNALENRTMIILNCSSGEIITMDCENQIVSTSNSDHSIYDDFNYVFFRIANDLDSIENVITSSLACDISFEYTPIKKVMF